MPTRRTFTSSFSKKCISVAQACTLEACKEQRYKLIISCARQRNAHSLHYYVEIHAMISFGQAFVKRCAKRDRSAQKQLFEKLYAPMYRVCFRYIGRQAEAEDCLMKGFMKAFQHLEQFEYKNESSLYHWIKKVMVNESLMDLRKMSLLSLTPGETLPDSPVYDDILEQLAAEEIYQLITELPAGYRTVFNLSVIEGHTHLEIAEMLNINESTSRSQLVKARNLLKTKIEKNNLLHEAKQG